MFVYCLFGSLWKSSLMSVVCVLAFCSDGKLWSARDMQL